MPPFSKCPLTLGLMECPVVFNGLTCECDSLVQYLRLCESSGSRPMDPTHALNTRIVPGSIQVNVSIKHAIEEAIASQSPYVQGWDNTEGLGAPLRLPRDQSSAPPCLKRSGEVMCQPVDFCGRVCELSVAL